VRVSPDKWAAISCKQYLLSSVISIMKYFRSLVFKLSNIENNKNLTDNWPLTNNSLITLIWIKPEHLMSMFFYGVWHKNINLIQSTSSTHHILLFNTLGLIQRLSYFHMATVRNMTIINSAKTDYTRESCLEHNTELILTHMLLSLKLLILNIYSESSPCVLPV
jgi:hypothetical protein